MSGQRKPVEKRFTVDYDDEGAYLRCNRGDLPCCAPINEAEAVALVAELVAYFGDHVADTSPAVPVPWVTVDDAGDHVRMEPYEAGIKLACGHLWQGDGSLAEAREFAGMCAATGDTAPCGECGDQQAVTYEVVQLFRDVPLDSGDGGS